MITILKGIGMTALALLVALGVFLAMRGIF